MKLDWGKSIALAITLFIGFIMYMVITMLSDKGYNHEMVVEEYYKKELTLNEKIESQKNGETVKDFIILNANSKGILVSLKDDLKDLKNSELIAYRASDESKDFTSKLNFNSKHEALVKRDLVPGVWEFSLYFIKDGKEFLVTKTKNIK